MAKREKTSLSLDPDLMNDVGHACIDLGLYPSDAAEEALRTWLSALKKVDGKYRRGDGNSRQIDGEFVKCPVQFRELITTMILRLIALDPETIPDFRKLMIRFSKPGEIESILEEEGAARARHTLRAVPNKK